jgi:cytidylate kinase
MTRSAAPLRPAEDAAILDTTNLDADGAFAAALEIITRVRGAARIQVP